MSKHKILLVEDDASLLDIACHQLRTAGHDVFPFTSADQAWASIKEVTYDLILTDLVLEGSINGDELLKKVLATGHEIPVILMTANGTIESGVRCVKMGAWDYLTKPFHWDDMLGQISKALQFHDLHKENHRLKQLVGSLDDFQCIIGHSSSITRVKKQLPRLAQSDAPVLIQGESGTGKEMVARSLHMNSSRKSAPFIAVNCGAIVRELAESELFGHAKGSFTGAHQDKPGYFVAAEGGTLFLDEISELPLDLQVKLLRVLQEGEVTPVGQAKATLVNVRLITATHVDLQEAIQNGDFREDLYYRVSVLPIRLPPLRERSGDLPELSRVLLMKCGAQDVHLSKSLLAELDAYHWPGNIRELENLMMRLHVMNPDVQILEPEHMPEPLERKSANQSLPFEVPDHGFDLEFHMKQLIQSALFKADGHQTNAAKLLKISRSALIYRMQKYGLTE
jgi:DNA-binding NtrC family response regulator